MFIKSQVKHCQHEVHALAELGKHDSGIMAAVRLTHGGLEFSKEYGAVEVMELVESLKMDCARTVVDIYYKDGTIVSLEQYPDYNIKRSPINASKKDVFKWQYAYSHLESDGTNLRITVLNPVQARDEATGEHATYTHATTVDTFARYGWLEEVYEAFEKLCA